MIMVLKDLHWNRSFFQVQILPTIMKVELKGYFQDDEFISMALLPKKTLLRNLSGFYRIVFSYDSRGNSIQYCHLESYHWYTLLTDTDRESFYVLCNKIIDFKEFEDYVDYGSAAVNTEFYLGFSNDTIQFQGNKYSLAPDVSDLLINAKYFTMSYSGSNSHKLQAKFWAPQALQSNISNAFPLISPWFTADMDELCLTIVVNGTGRAEINITAENIAQGRFPLQNFIKFYEPGTVFHLISSLPKKLKNDKIRLILTVHDDMSPITIQRISSCNGKDKSDVGVLHFEEISRIAYDVNTGSNNDDKHWCSKNTSNLIYPNITNTFNGGCKRDLSFACPAGFTGQECKTACGRNRFGGDCKGICSIYSYECQGLLLCTPAIGCLCAPGYSGVNCETKCNEGNYGNDCEQVCGNCENHSACDIYTGHCAACGSGYALPFCKETFPVVISPPEVLISTYGQVKVTPKLTEYSGKGIPSIYQIQYRELGRISEKDGTNEWIVEDSLNYTVDSIESDLIPDITNDITIKGLDHGKFYEIRTILYDNNLNSYQGDNVPITKFLSLCSIPENVDYHITSNSNSTSVTINWQYKNNSEYLCPVIHYEVSQEENWQWVSANITDNSLSLSSLLPTRVIKFKIRAYTSGGFAPYSETVTVSTKPEDPGPVKSISSQHKDNYELIEWYPPENVGNDQIYYHLYIQCHKRIGCNSECKATDSFDLHVSSSTAKLYNLLPFTQYLVSVSAIRGPPTTILIGTEMSVPTEKVKAVLSPIVANDSVTVFWEPVEVCSGFFRGYIYRLHKANDTKIIAEGFTKETNLTVNDLSAKTEYLFKIFIINLAGRDEDNYLLLRISTSATVPEPVENLTVYKRGRNLLGLRWKQPKNLYGKLKSFTISYGYGNSREVITVPPLPCIVWPHLYCHTLENLSPMKKYNISVAARNTEVNEDGISTSVKEITREGTAGVPENVTVINISSTSFAVSWKYPSMGNGVIRTFLMSIEEVEQYNTEQCCQVIPLKEIIVEKELPNYTAEVTGLYPASTYTVSLSAKTISFGPSVTLTLYTRPPSMPLQYLPNVTVMTQEEWIWLPEQYHNYYNYSYQSLIKGIIVLVVENSTSENFQSGIENKKVNEELKKIIRSNFYFVAECERYGEIIIGNGDKLLTQWGTLNNTSLKKGQSYSLATVQISEYCGIFNTDVVFSTPFTAM